MTRADKMKRFGRQEIAIFLVIAAALLLQLRLSPPIWHHGEAREALVVQGLLQHQQWILPLRNGDLPSKPPLFHWIAALLAGMFGLNDFVVRLPSAIAGVLMALTCFAVGYAAGGKRTAWLSLGALLGMYEFWNSATQARVDMVFATCITMSLAGFFFWYRDGRRALAQAVCYLGAGFAVLAKGPAGLVLPVLVIAVFLAVERRLPILLKLWSWPLVLLVLFIDCGWYAIAYRAGGNEFLALQLGRENLDRLVGTGSFDSQRNTFVTVSLWLVTRALPWSAVLPWTVLRMTRGYSADVTERFLHAWWVSIFIVFAFAAGKRAVYLLPVFPAIALLAARALNRLIDAGATESAPHASTPVIPWITPKWIAYGIAVFDIILALVNHKGWRDAEPREARLGFISRIAEVVPRQRQLFAAPELSETDLIVIAYRLQREIKRKSVTSAAEDEFYLVPIDPTREGSFKTLIPATLAMQGVGLVKSLHGGAMGQSRTQQRGRLK